MINKYINTLVFSLLTSLCSAQYEFAGELDKAHKTDRIFLYKYVGVKAYPFDTISVKRGKFKKTYDATFDKGLYIIGLDTIREDIVLTEPDINFKIPVSLEEMPWKSYSKANADYFEFRKVFNSYDFTLSNLDKKYQSFQHLQQAQPEYFNKMVGELRSSLDSINNLFDSFMNNMAMNATSSYGKKLGNFFAINTTTTKDNYFKSSDFSDNTFALGDMIIRKFNYYFMRFERLNETNIALETQRLLGYSKTKNISKELVFESIANNSVIISESQTRALIMQHNSEFGKGTVVGKRMKGLLPPPPPTIGSEVPEIIAIDKDGNKFNLSDLRGQVVLIDFWASWCGPCRRESPNVVAVYNKYKDKGFTIVSISADKNKDAWLKAVKDDNYTWDNHILAQTNGYKATRDFQVKGYPTMFLVGTDGKLINTGNALRGLGLEQNLKQVFGE